MHGIGIKKYWNQLAQGKDLSDGMVRQLIDHSYDEVVKKLPLASRVMLGKYEKK